MSKTKGILALALILVGCAGRAGDDSSAAVSYQRSSAQQAEIPRETLLRYPDNWPEISARRERGHYSQQQ